MKKLVSLALILSMALCLIACSKKATDSTYTLEKDGAISTFKLHAEGDVIKKITIINSISIENVSEEAMPMVDEQIDKLKSQYEGLAGVTCTSDKTDSMLTLTIDMDISDKDNFRTLVDNGALPVDKKDAKYLSLKATVKGFEDEGYTKVEDK